MYKPAAESAAVEAEKFLRSVKPTSDEFFDAAVAVFVALATRQDHKPSPRDGEVIEAEFVCESLGAKEAPIAMVSAGLPPPATGPVMFTRTTTPFPPPDPLEALRLEFEEALSLLIDRIRTAEEAASKLELRVAALELAARRGITPPAAVAPTAAPTPPRERRETLAEKLGLTRKG